MKKLLILTSILLLMLAASLMATDTRVTTMGDNNNILLDDANIWLYPSRTFEYPNIAVAEFGHDYYYDKSLTPYDFYRFGTHWKFGSDNPMVLGTYFSNIPAQYPTDLNGGSLVNFEYLQENNRIDLFYGRQFTEYNFGAHLNAIHSSYDETDLGATYRKEGYGYYNLDLGLTPKTGKWDVALDFGMGTWTQEDSGAVKLTEPDGFMDLSVMGRYFAQQGPNYTLVPHIGFGYSKRGAKFYGIDEGGNNVVERTEKYTATGFDLGCGWNYTPATNVLAVFDFGLQYMKWKGENTPTGAATDEVNDTYTTIPYFKMGLDADVFKWMDVRFGATSYWNREKWEPNTTQQQKYNWPSNATYLGFGFHWNRLHVDTYTDAEVFLQGFNFISGNSTYDPMNIKISALYEMM